MERSFSQRMGFKPVKNIIQINSMDMELKNALWNDLTTCIWKNEYAYQIILSDYRVVLKKHYIVQNNSPNICIKH